MKYLENKEREREGGERETIIRLPVKNTKFCCCTNCLDYNMQYFVQLYSWTACVLLLKPLGVVPAQFWQWPLSSYAEKYYSSSQN